MGNYSFNRNKVLEDDSTVAYPWQRTIGNKVDQRFGLIALGLFESTEEIAASPVQVGDTRPGDIRYKDINGDGKIDEYDKVPIGWGSVPEIIYGFGFSVGWKSLSLSAMFQGAAHVDAMLSGEGVLPFAQGSSRGNLLSNITDRWTEANPRQDVFYPRLSIGNMNMNYEASTWWLKKYQLPAPEEHRTLLHASRPLDETHTHQQCAHFHPGRQPAYVQQVQTVGRGTGRRPRRQIP